jgi:hypothetical protein
MSHLERKFKYWKDSLVQIQSEFENNLTTIKDLSDEIISLKTNNKAIRDQNDFEVKITKIQKVFDETFRL